MSNILEQLSQTVIEGKSNRVQELTKLAIDNGCDPEEIISQGLIA